jgi:hypothetical protein
MIAHVVLFRPKPNLGDDARAELAGAFESATRAIPSIRRARIGPRVTHGRAYESLMRVSYPYAAILEFDHLDGLKAYLDHPAHERLATLFFEAFEEALMYDFELQEGAAGLAPVSRAATASEGLP